MKLLVILCVPFTAPHAHPGGSPGSNKQSNGRDTFKPTAANVKPDDVSNTSVLPNCSIAGPGPSSLSPSSHTHTSPGHQSLCPWQCNIDVGRRRRPLAQSTPWHRVAYTSHTHMPCMRHPYRYTKEINKYICGKSSMP